MFKKVLFATLLASSTSVVYAGDMDLFYSRVNPIVAEELSDLIGKEVEVNFNEQSGKNNDIASLLKGLKIHNANCGDYIVAMGYPELVGLEISLQGLRQNKKPQELGLLVSTKATVALLVKGVAGMEINMRDGFDANCKKDAEAVVPKMKEKFDVKVKKLEKEFEKEFKELKAKSEEK